MAEMTVQVTEKMGKFVAWAAAKGQDEITRLVRERLAMMKEECARNNGMKDSDGFVWNDLLEPSGNPEQWKRGGDCNMCRRQPYCLKQCRANRLLKAIATPFLYGLYMNDNPDAVMSEAAKVLTPEMLLKQVGIEEKTDEDHTGDEESVPSGV